MDVFESRLERGVTGYAFRKHDNRPGTMHDNAAGEATKKRLLFGRLLSMSAANFQGSAMAATGEWSDEVGCSKLTSVLFESAVRY